MRTVALEQLRSPARHARPLPLPLPVLFHVTLSIAGGLYGVAAALDSSLFDFFQKPLCDRFGAEASVDRRHAPGEVRHAAVPALVVSCGRRPLKGLLIARPYSRRLALGRRSTKRGERFRHGFGRRNQSQAFKLLHSDGVARDGFLNPHSWEIGMVFDLEILAADETR